MSSAEPTDGALNEAPFWRQVCSSGHLIVSGPLNDAHRVTVHGEALFVRWRQVFDTEYGQSFAGERQVPTEIAHRAAIPQLRHLVRDETGREAIAVFDWIDGRKPRCGELPDDLIDLLAAVHEIPAPGFGNLGGPYATDEAGPFIGALIVTEAERLHQRGPETDARHAAEAALEHLVCFAGEPPCLCHGDIHRDNVIIKRDGAIALVDWEAVRYRVAAADFNQLTVDWLSEEQAGKVVAAYAERCGRDRRTLGAQIALMRLLWHLRTYNFKVLVRRERPSRHLRHLRAATDEFKAMQRYT